MKTKAAFALAWQLFGSKGKTDLYSFIPFKAAGGVKTISHKLWNNTHISKFSFSQYIAVVLTKLCNFALF